jgi:spermidine synthase
VAKINGGGRVAGAFAALTLLLTGAAALAYEVAWQRYLAILTGTDHAATAVTLAVFLGGLSLGYALCGRLSERAASPLVVYAGLEAAIGAWGLAFPWLHTLVSRIAEGWSFSRPFGLIAGSLGVALPLILLPAILMGATVPFMTRGLVSDPSGLTGTHARVYGLNTLGAVAGTLVAGFVLVPALGLHATVYVATATHLLAAAILVALSRDRWHPEQPRAIGRAPRPDGVRFSPTLLAALAGLSGAATMAQENARIRLLRLTLGGTPYSFAVVVAGFVAAIAVGSLAVARRDRIGPRSLWVAAAVSCVAWIALFPTYDSWPWLVHVLRFAGSDAGLGFVAFHAVVQLVLLIVLLPAVAPLGMLLPLIFHEHRVSVRDAGRVSGALLGWNALGALAGSLGGGLLVFHFVDLPVALLGAPLLLAALAWLATPRGDRLGRPLATALLVVTLALAVGQPGFDGERLVFGTFRMQQPVSQGFGHPTAFHTVRTINRRVVHREDGPLVSVAVVEEPTWELPLPRPRSIYIDGKSESNTYFDRETLLLSAHLPLLLAEGRDRALVIGQGTGLTAAALARWSELARIDLVELSPAVARTLPLFRVATEDVGADPRLHLHVEDARHFLSRPGEGWDVIVSEPSHVWNSGNDLMFTLEFLESVRRRLRPGGVFLMWLHLYETDPAVACPIVSAVATVFPEVHAFRGTRGDLLVTAAASLRDRSEEALSGALETRPEVARSLAEAGVDGAAAILEREILEFPAYAARARTSCAPHVAGEARLAYRAARALYDGRSLSEDELFGVGAESIGD